MEVEVLSVWVLCVCVVVLSVTVVEVIVLLVLSIVLEVFISVAVDDWVLVIVDVDSVLVEIARKQFLKKEGKKLKMCTAKLISSFAFT